MKNKFINWLKKFFNKNKTIINKNKQTNKGENKQWRNTR